MIDHIWTNQLSDVKSGVLESDFPNACSSKFTRALSFGDHSEVCVRGLLAEVGEFLNEFASYDNCYTDFRIKFYHDTIINLNDRHCPIRKKVISFKRCSKPWISDH